MWTSSPSRSTTTSASKRSSFLFRRKNGQLAREAQPLGRLLFFLEEKKQKKINCGKVISLPFCRFSRHPAQNGRFTYEPSVFSFQAGRAESVFPRMTSSPAVSFVSFLQEKKTFPPFFLEEKTVSLRGKRSPADGRTLAHPALSSVGIPQRVCLPPPPCLCPCPPRLRASFPVQTDHAKENQLRKSDSPALLPVFPASSAKRTVHIRTVRFFVPSRTSGKAFFPA